MTTYDKYRQSWYERPERTLRWNLYGAGLENLGRNGEPEWVLTPQPGPRQLLVRMDAVGICFSDVKIVRLGENHPRLIGRDLKQNPVVMGHEVSCTLVQVGEELQDRFHPGERYAIQADVFYGGKSMALGYVLEGGFTQYGLLTEPLIFGDEGCYLLPISDRLGYAEAALVEPWACVVASYQIAVRPAPKPGGRLLVIAQAEPHVEYLCSCLQKTLESGERRPDVVVVAGAKGTLRAQLGAAQGKGTQWQELPETWIHEEGLTREAWQALSEKWTGGEGFDDLLLFGNLPAQVLQNALHFIARGGVLVFVHHRPLPPLEVDVGRIHYDRIAILGTTSWDAAEAYQRTRTSALTPDGQLLLLGTGGPMGQMQLHYALSLPHPPRHIVAVDRHEERLDALGERFASLAEARGVQLTLFDNAKMEPEAFQERLWQLSGGRGYEDIVCLSSAPDSILQVYPLLTDGGLLNLFAGVPRGTHLPLDLTPLCTRHVRILGSSGSSLADMRVCLEKTESGELPTRRVLAAIGGLRAAQEGIAAMQAHRYPGKIVIFPNLPDLPLLGLLELRDHFPTVYAQLEEGRFWTLEAEKALFEAQLKNK